MSEGVIPALKAALTSAADKPTLPKQEWALLEALRLLPTTGVVRQIPSALGGRSTFDYIELGSEWQEAAPLIASTLASVFGSHSRVKRDGERLVESLTKARTTPAGPPLFYVPKNDVGLHITLPEDPTDASPGAGSGAGAGAGSGAGGGGLVGRTVHFSLCGIKAVTNSKLGSPSDFDPHTYHARWFLLEVAFEAPPEDDTTECCQPVTGFPAPHITLCCYGVKVGGGGGGKGAGKGKGGGKGGGKGRR